MTIPATIITTAKALIQSLTFDDSGDMGYGGNGGLISRETIRKSDELRMAIAKHEASQAESATK